MHFTLNLHLGLAEIQLYLRALNSEDNFFSVFDEKKKLVWSQEKA